MRFQALIAVIIKKMSFDLNKRAALWKFSDISEERAPSTCSVDEQAKHEKWQLS
jgi:hypothetical protein